MSAINRTKNPCKNPACGNTLFVADYAYDAANKFVPVWHCTNCGTNQPRQQRMRPTNARRAHQAYFAIVDAWKKTDTALTALVEAGVPSGCLLVHGSMMNYHLRQLMEIKKPTNWDLRYHAAKAKEELARAKDFVASKQEGL
jgi:hypothetical protein